MQYKWAAELAQIEGCPPGDVLPGRGDAYRFVHELIEDERNFTCVAKLNPARKLRPGDLCSGLGLSMFATRESAIRRYRSLLATNRNLPKTLGSKLAVGTLEPGDGRMSKPSASGHTDLWQAEEADLPARFRIVADLIP